MWWEKASDSANLISFNEYPYLVYGRVSTEKDEQVSSLENQVDICRNWLERNNFEWNEKAIVIDNGISGTVLLARAAMQLILEKARKREIKMVLFKSIHRLARDMKDSLEIKEVLLAHGVRVVTIEEGYDSLYEGKNDMKFEMFSMFAAQYPKSLSVSISAVLAAKVRRGEHIGGKLPYGFRGKDKKMVIHEEEAEVIRYIYDLYNNFGYGFKKITNILNEGLRKGEVLGPQSKDKWQVTTVQRILRNPTYCGVFVLNRYTKIKVGGRKKQIENPPEKWVTFKDHHPKIISIEDWEKANNKEYTSNKTRITAWNEFRGISKCSECGSNMVIVQSYKKKKDGTRTEWKYLKCSAYRRSGEHACVNHTPIQYEDFREFVLKRLKRKGKKISVDFGSNFHDQKKAEIKHLEKEINIIEENRKELIDLYIEEKLITKAEFLVKRKEYEENILRMKDRMFVLQQDEEVKIDISNIQEAFQQLENTEEDLRHAFEILIEEINIHPEGNVDIKYTFEFKGK
ncbi:recombinase family protein [Metabacillus bambusae]|uniref:Recombinase family protein n=1 Tax=Metabacillus bambusae TaxID=2795218 RepID=A0ABS3NAW1_9BACI|nr:recombinase family protein [Metabacillus bambusae]MBO1515078.1 recombinase family protein [Metabacillus bambusae]